MPSIASLNSRGHPVIKLEASALQSIPNAVWTAIQLPRVSPYDGPEPTVLSTNLVPNPSLETNATNWAVNQYCTIARSTAQAFIGTASLAITSTGATTMNAVTSYIPCKPSTTYTISGYVRSATISKVARLDLNLYDAATTYVGGSTGNQVTTATLSWTRMVHTYTTPSTCTQMRLLTLIFNPAAINEVHYFDCLMIEEGSATNPYFDGDGPGSNLITNPSFETNTTGWAAESGSTTIARVTTQAYVGTASLQATASATGAPAVVYGNLPVKPSTTYTVQARVRSAVAGPVWLYFGGTPTSVNLNANTWTLISLTATTPSSGVITFISLSYSGQPGASFFVDAVMVEETNTLNPYYEGTQGTEGYRWNGTAHGSSSSHILGPSPALEVASNYSIKINRTGWYKCSAEGFFASNATGRRLVQICLDTTLDPATVIATGDRTEVGHYTYWTAQTTLIRSINAGTYVRIAGYQNAGAALNSYVSGEYCSSLTVSALDYWSY